MGQNSLFPKNYHIHEESLLTNLYLQRKKNEILNTIQIYYLKTDKKIPFVQIYIIIISPQLHELKQKWFLPADNRLEPHEVIITPPPEEPRLSQASEGSEAASEAPSETSSPSGKTRRYRGDTSKRRKGVYITQWPESLDTDRNKLSAQSSEERDEPPATPSDLSDCEGHTPRR